MGRGTIVGGLAVVALAVGAWVLLHRDGDGGPRVVEGDLDGVDAADAAAPRDAELARRAGALARPEAVAAPTWRGVLRGRVIDADGKPLAGVPLVATRDGYTSGAPVEAAARGRAADERARRALAAFELPTLGDDPTAPRATSDVDGRFQIAVDVDGGWSVDARPSAPLVGARAWGYLRREAAEAVLTIRCVPGAALRGRVLDANDRPVAAVVAGWWYGKERRSSLPSVAADPATGDFALVTPPGRVTVEIRVPGRLHLSVMTKAPRQDVLVIRLPAGGTLRGRVVDGAGAAIEGVDVLVNVGRSAQGAPIVEGVVAGSGRGKTGADGAYRIDGLPAGRVQSVTLVPRTGRARADESGSARWWGTEVRAGVETTMDLVLGRGGTVAGRVVDGATGAAIPDAEVLLLPGGSSWQSDAVRGGCDAAGAFTFDDVLPGRYALLPRSPRHYFAPAVGEVDAQNFGYDPRGGATPDAPVVVVTREGERVERDLAMTAGIEIRGTVVGPEGEAVGGAEIRTATPNVLAQGVQRWGVRWNPSTAAIATSAPDGAFRLENLPPARGLLLYAAKGTMSGPASAPIVLAAGAPPVVVALTLRAGATIAGRVLDADGATVAGRGVHFSSLDRKVPGWGSTTTGDDGAFRFEGVPATLVQLQSWDDAGGGQVTVAVEPALSPGERREGLDLRIARASWLRGVALDEAGNPLANTSLFVQGPQAREVSTQDDGTFDVAVAEGAYMIGRRLGRGWGLEGAGTAVTAPADGLRITVPARDPTTTLLGGRILAPDGSPIALVTLVAAGTPLGEAIGGEFRREVAAKPPFDLVVSGPRGSRGEPLDWRSATVRIEKETLDLVVTLEPGFALRGRVLDAAGAGVAGLAVGVGAATATTDADGRFRAVGLASADEVPVIVSAPSRFAPPPPTVAKPGGGEVVVRLAPSGFVAGRLVGLDAVSGASGYVTTSIGRGAQVDGDGAFRIVGLPAEGTVDLTANTWVGNGDSGSPFAPATRTGVRIGTDDVVITLVRGVYVRGTLVDENGKPVSSGWMQAAGPTPATGRIQASGAFVLGAMSAGSYQVTVFGPQGNPIAGPIQLEAPADNVRIVTPRMRRIRGRVVGGVVGEAYLQAVVEGAAPVGAQVTAGTGEFALDVASDGPFLLTVQAGERYGRLEGVRPGEAVEVTLVLGLEIRGTVDSESRAATGTWVEAKAAGWTSYAEVDRDGAFTLKGLPPGRYALAVMRGENWQRGARSEAVDAGATGVRLR